MKHLTSIIAACALASALALGGCAGQAPQENAQPETDVEASEQVVESVEQVEGAAEEETAEAKQPFSLTRDDLTIDETIADDADESPAINADGTSESYRNVEVVKTGDADGDEADFYGTNAAVYATNGATLDLSDVIVTTDGFHANAVFSYGEGTTINIAHSIIETTNNCSGGIMVTGGGTLNATDLFIHTTGNSSASIRSDRGGGT
ncbi:MAG: hypothetical protein IJG82_07085, partial [Atopobiaceae bacterium]|nr:hypothetical protein [Atopobiaceae bacterium]